MHMKPEQPLLIVEDSPEDYAATVRADEVWCCKPAFSLRRRRRCPELPLSTRSLFRAGVVPSTVGDFARFEPAWYRRPASARDCKVGRQSEDDPGPGV